jgi:hypothetical protein
LEASLGILLECVVGCGPASGVFHARWAGVWIGHRRDALEREGLGSLNCGIELLLTIAGSAGAEAEVVGVSSLVGVFLRPEALGAQVEEGGRGGAIGNDHFGGSAVRRSSSACHLAASSGFCQAV